MVAGLLRGAQFAVERLTAACDVWLYATDVADYLVAHGLAFSEAHGVSGALVRRCLERGIQLGDLSREELTELSPAFDDAFHELFEPRASLASKRSQGGVAPDRLREQLAVARAAL